MAKRAHDEVVTTGSPEPVNKKVKKERGEKKDKDKKKHEGANDDVADLEKQRRKAEKKAAKKAAKEAAANGNGNVNPQDALSKAEEDAKVAKAEKKALKRSKREREEENGADNLADHETTANTAPILNSGEEAKVAARAERKAAQRAKHSGEDSSAVPKMSNGESKSDTNSNTPAITTAGYLQHPGLSALPQADIDTFVTENLITTSDPKSTTPQLRPITSFDYLPITDKAQRAPFKDYTKPTPIQAAVWPHLFAGRDVVGVAETGSGKTMAFGVPCIKHISSLPLKEQKRGIKACIVSPTRELALQIHEQLVKLATPAGLKVACVYGGVNKDQQRETLKGASTIVATPGRLNDYIQEGSIDLSGVNYLVLDEADRMLDKGFEVEMKKIIATCPSVGRQTLMFTATWPPSVRELASTFMSSPVRVIIGDNPTGELRANVRIDQQVEVLDPYDKNDRLVALLKQYQTGKNKTDRILVFCLYKKEATRIEGFIRSKGFNVAGIHGDLSQPQRTASLEAFKNGKVPCLVATDVAARGLDIPAVKVVINVTFPLTVEDYVHRIGRTGRAGQTGKAITLFTEHEKALAGALINVLKAANQPVPDALLKFGTTVKKKTHEAYGAFYRDPGEMKQATKITFD